MANNEKLMSEFPPVSTADWEEVIKADLKGADYDKKLVWKTGEGFNVRPYYRAEDLKNIKFVGAGIGEFPYVRSIGKDNKWRITQTLPVERTEKANADALKAIAAGSEAISFIVKSEDLAGNIDKLLQGIDITKTELTFTGKNIPEIAKAVISKAKAENIRPEDLRINFNIDPIIEKLSLNGEFGCCPDGSKCFSSIADLIKELGSYKRARFVNVNGQNFHNSGSTIVQELAFTLAVGHEYVVKLMEQGLTIDQAAPSIRFTMAVSSNYFMEIAKFRAGRMLWANIIKPYNPTRGCASKMYTHAVTSKWNMTVYDPYVNMLRGTTEAMSASIAGVQSLEVLPFNAAFECPTEFSSRIARNVQLLLKNESHFDNVVDPSGGSYYIENLTQSIAENAWELFKEIEKRGGYINAFESGYIKELIEESANKKDHNIATRRQILLGTNQYPNFTEKADKELNENVAVKGACLCGCDCEPVCNCGPDCDCGCQDGEECSCGDDCNCGNPNRLTPYRGAMPFEQLRLRVDKSGRNPKAFMLTAGSLAMARARSQFSSNFFGCAGIEIIDNTFFKDINEGINAALSSGAEIVVLCAADDDYAELAPIVYDKLAGKAIFVVAGAPACAEELSAKGITNFINVKSNVLGTLKDYVKEIGIRISDSHESKL